MPAIFLSPSVQEYNAYAGGGNEEDVMNQIADAMEDIGVYRLRFNKNMTLSELERAQTKLKKEALVEEVHINTALDVTGDAEEGEIEKKDPVYPEDPWNGASWNMDVPRGENWGMEAIHAPAAWGYLSELSRAD